MIDKTPKKPDRLFIDKKDKKYYDRLKQEEMFRYKENRHLFLLALGYGFKNDIKVQLKSKEGFVRTEYLSSENWSLIKAIAITVKSIEVLSNPELIFQIVEEYAHGGIKILFDEVQSTPFASFDKKFEKELHEIYDELNLGD